MKCRRPGVGLLPRLRRRPCDARRARRAVAGRRIRVRSSSKMPPPRLVLVSLALLLTMLAGGASNSAAASRHKGERTGRLFFARCNPPRIIILASPESVPRSEGGGGRGVGPPHRGMATAANRSSSLFENPRQGQKLAILHVPPRNQVSSLQLFPLPATHFHDPSRDPAAVGAAALLFFQ